MKKLLIPTIVMILIAFAIQIRSQEDTPIITKGEDWIKYDYRDSAILELHGNQTN